MTQRSISVMLREEGLEIRPVSDRDLEAVLQVYRQCEDFPALGPVAAASMDVVIRNLEISKGEGGIFCGIYTGDGKMIGVVDHVLKGFEGDPHPPFFPS